MLRQLLVDFPGPLTKLPLILQQEKLMWMAQRSRVQKWRCDMCDWSNYKKNHHVQRRLVWGGLWHWWRYWSIFLCSFIWIRHWILHRRGHKQQERGGGNVIRSLAGSSIETREIQKKLKMEKKATCLNEKTLEPVGGALRCRLGTSICHLPGDNLNQLKKRSLQCAFHRWANRKAEFKKYIIMCKNCRVSLCLWCYRAFHEDKDVEKLRETADGVMDKNGYCAGYIST